MINVSRMGWHSMIWPGSNYKTYLEMDSKGTILRKNQLGYHRSGAATVECIFKASCIPVGPLLGMISLDLVSSSEVDEFYGTSFSSIYKRSPQVMWTFIGLIFASCTLAALFTYWIGRRNSFTRKQMGLYMLGNFLFGWGGVLTMIMIHKWVGKTKCTSCGKKRLQINDHCEHCGAEFPLPELDGTEIFIDSHRPVPVAELSSSAS